MLGGKDTTIFTHYETFNGGVLGSLPKKVVNRITSPAYDKFNAALKAACEA